MATVFDYVFYRTARFFYRRDGRGAIRALISVSTVQGMVPSALLVLLQRHFYTRQQLAPYAKAEAGFFCACLVGLLVRNYAVYPRRYQGLRTRWNDESALRNTLGGMGVIAAIVVSWLAVLSLGLLA